MNAITSDFAALYEIIRSNPASEIRKDAATHLLTLIEEGREVDKDVISVLYQSEKDIAVATELKRALNKLQIRQMLHSDPTSEYDRRLSAEQEAKILQEIEKLRNVYDKSRGQKGSFDKKYKIIGKIVDGGMGRIFKAIRNEDKKPVAIKFLMLEELTKNNNRERIIARFRREGDLLTKRLNHPNIVEAFEYGENDGEYFLIMEYVKGGTVNDLIKNNPLDFDTFKIIGLQLCDAVEYLHKNDVIHRDIKPANMLVEDNESFHIKLTDFGLSKDKRDGKLSRVSFQAGTDDYSSPQQLKDARSADERDDIFSMGKTFYEMLTKKTLCANESYTEIGTFNVALPVELNSIIKKCIESDKADRFQNVATLRTAINRIR